jgi:hypothetical protein
MSARPGRNQTGVGSGVFNLSRFRLISNFLVCQFLFRHGLVRMPRLARVDRYALGYTRCLVMPL